MMPRISDHRDGRARPEENPDAGDGHRDAGARLLKLVLSAAGEASVASRIQRRLLAEVPTPLAAVMARNGLDSIRCGVRLVAGYMGSVNHERALAAT
jgi:hypothetical protein